MRAMSYKISSLVFVVVVLCGATALAQYNDPASMTAKAAHTSITVDTKLSEPDWQLATPYLVFGPNPILTADQLSVTGGTLIWGSYPDTSHTSVKFLRNGMKLYIAIQSDDKSIGRFGDSWEGDGLFMQIKDASGSLRELHVYYNDDTRAGTPRADSAVVESGGGKPVPLTQWQGIGLVNTPGTAYDTTKVGTGYTLELAISLDSLGFTPDVQSIEASLDIFDADGYPPGAKAFEGPPTRAFYKTWWGSEWGSALRTINLEPQRPYDDPPVTTAKSVSFGGVAIDG